MNNSGGVLLVVAVIVLVPMIWLMAVYNRLVKTRQHVRESWADIDVELKRRYDLIPNLIEIVKGYAEHERETLERVVRLRNQAVASRGSAESQARDETQLQAGVKTLFAVAESYPQLKADAHFLSLQQDLADTEDRIAAARRFFNGNVRDINQLCQTIPTSFVARMFGFKLETYFDLSSDAERAVPRTSFSTEPSSLRGI